MGDPSDEEVVRVAAEAAESVVLSRVDRDAIEDIDVTVRFENGVLDVDVYLHAPTVDDAEQIADDATLAAGSAVDSLFGEG